MKQQDDSLCEQPGSDLRGCRPETFPQLTPIVYYVVLYFGLTVQPRGVLDRHFISFLPKGTTIPKLNHTP